MVTPWGNKGVAWRKDNARNNARCTQARKATHGLDGQHQDVDRTLRGRVNQNTKGNWGPAPNFWSPGTTNVLVQLSRPSGDKNCRNVHSFTSLFNKKLSYRRGTTPCFVSVEILPIAIATVQKLLVRLVLDKSKLWSWRVTVGQCVINMCSQPWRDQVASIVLQVS